MGPEKEIVQLWLNGNGFFTITDINAGNRVIGMIAIKQGAEPRIAHVEVACGVSGSFSTGKDDLLNRFNNASVVKKVSQTIKAHTGKDRKYEKLLITTMPVRLKGVRVEGFDRAMFEFVNRLDRQYYANNVMRTLQLAKFSLLSNPGYAVGLIGNTGERKALTHQSRGQFMERLFEQDFAKKFFSKKSSEGLLTGLLKDSTLRNPERLARVMDGMFTGRKAERFLNAFLRQKGIKTPSRPEIKHRTLEHFVTV